MMAARKAARRRVLRGTVANGAFKKIQLDNMDPSDGWVITDFQVSTTSVQQLNIVVGTLCTEEPGLATWAVPGGWNYSESRQMGWARYGTLTAGDESGAYSLIDRNNIIIEDLFIVGYLRNEATDELMNYYIEMEQLSFPKTTGIMAMVQNRSQDAD